MNTATIVNIKIKSAECGTDYKDILEKKAGSGCALKRIEKEIKMNKLSARGVFTVVVIMYILAELIAGLIEKLL